MEEQVFIDKNGQELIIKHRKSAIFFEGKADIAKPNSYGQRHAEYVCIKELKKLYDFSEEDFKCFIAYCQTIGNESWKKFAPKEMDSLGSEYDDYYDRDFDNNGSLSVGVGFMKIEGPYAQLKSNGEIVRLIKFNKRKFESFVYDLECLI